MIDAPAPSAFLETDVSTDEKFDLAFQAEFARQVDETQLPIRRIAALQKRIWTLGNRMEQLRADLACDKVRNPKSRKPATADQLAKLESMADEVEDLRQERDGLFAGRFVLVAEALGRRYPVSEVRGWFTRAVELGAAEPKVTVGLIKDLAYGNKVPNAPFRAKLDKLDAASGTVRKCAEAVANGDLAHFRRMTGQSTSFPKAEHLPFGLTLFIDYDKATKLAKLLGMTPHDAGI